LLVVNLTFVISNDYFVFVNSFLTIFQKISGKMAHNVPVVYDVFAVAIKERGAFQQPQKCGGEKPHKGRSPTTVFRSPSRYCGEAYTDLLCEVPQTKYILVLTLHHHLLFFVCRS
jgi:hypothetical protein